MSILSELGGFLSRHISIPNYEKKSPKEIVKASSTRGRTTSCKTDCVNLTLAYKRSASNGQLGQGVLDFTFVGICKVPLLK